MTISGKSMALFGGEQSARIIMGVKVPIVFVPGFDNIRANLAPIALAHKRQNVENEYTKTVYSNFPAGGGCGKSYITELLY